MRTRFPSDLQTSVKAGFNVLILLTGKDSPDVIKGDTSLSIFPLRHFDKYQCCSFNVEIRTTYLV
jgi:hypothetical protein